MVEAFREMTDLAVAVCSIATTQRRRYFWAAWWTSAPTAFPFRKPDASNGGAATREAALAEAEKVSGRTLLVAEPKWARAWLRVLRGQTAWASREAAEPKARTEERPAPSPNAHDTLKSIWTTLGVNDRATLGEIKSAFRARAKVVHPDLGGDADAFRELKRAYEEALKRATKDANRPKRKPKAT